MRIPYRWLREFVDTAAEPREAAERLTMAGIETSLVAEGAAELSGLVVAEVLAVDPHPGAATLRVCEVSTGAERYRVVCGAPNVRAGCARGVRAPGRRASRRPARRGRHHPRDRLGGHALLGSRARRR